MDKNKLIDEILAEWAMRSPDGLAGGHDTPENVAVLNDLVKEYEKTKKPSKDVDPKEFSVLGLNKNKRIPSDVGKKIIHAFSKLPTESRQRFVAEYYNECTVKQAIDFLNSNMGGGEYSAFIEELDSDKVRTKAGVGRGEYILSILIRDCMYSGQESGDLELKSGKKIDVKEVDSKTKVFRATKTSMGMGNFEKIPFVNAVNELISFVRGHEDRVEAFKQLCDDAGLEDSGKQKINHFTKRFFEVLNWDKMTSTTVVGLLKIMMFLQNIPKDKESEYIGIGDHAEFDLDNKKATLKIDQIPQRDKEKIVNQGTSQEKVTMIVSPVTGDTSGGLIKGNIKKLKLFQNPGKGTEAFSPANIARDMFTEMQKHHYNGGIIFYDAAEGYEYEDNLSNTKTPWYFYTYQQTGPVFTKKASALFTEPKT